MKTKPHGKDGPSRERLADVFKPLSELQTQPPMSATRLKEQLRGHKNEASVTWKAAVNLRNGRIRVCFHHFSVLESISTSALLPADPLSTSKGQVGAAVDFLLEIAPAVWTLLKPPPKNLENLQMF